jgi:uncharacterized membrane protein
MMIAYRENEVHARTNARLHGSINSGFMLAMGIQLMRVEKTFLTSPIYEVMAKVASEEMWGIILIVVGSLRLFVILFSIKNNMNSHVMGASFVFTFISMGIWLAMSAAFWVVNPLGLSCLAYMAFAFHDGANFSLVAKMTGITKGRERQLGLPVP